MSWKMSLCPSVAPNDILCSTSSFPIQSYVNWDLKSDLVSHSIPSSSLSYPGSWIYNSNIQVTPKFVRLTTTTQLPSRLVQLDIEKTPETMQVQNWTHDHHSQSWTLPGQGSLSPRTVRCRVKVRHYPRHHLLSLTSLSSQSPVLRLLPSKFLCIFFFLCAVKHRFSPNYCHLLFVSLVF